MVPVLTDCIKPDPEFLDSQQRYCLAIDQGTSSSRAIVFDATGEQITSAQRPVGLNRIDDSHVEQDSAELLESVQEVIAQVLAHFAADNLSISHAGLTTQRSSIVAWKPSDGTPLSPVLSWQDTRGSNWINAFSKDAALIQQHTGLRLSAHYSVSKMQWLLHNNPEVKTAIQRRDCVITPLASFILYHISDNQQINIDVANAARTLLCNLYQRNWDDRLLALFQVDKAILPTCRPIRLEYGHIQNTNIKIRAVNGDQTSALYSNGNPANNALRVNLGTGAFALSPASSEDIQSEEFFSSGLLAGISSSSENSAEYYIEGTVNGAGAALDWLQKQRCMDDTQDSLSSLPQAEPNCLFINSIGKLGSPIWRGDIDPQFVDLQGRNYNPDDQQAMIAALESIVFLLCMNIDRIRSINKELAHIEISGGLSRLGMLNQALADLSNLSVNQSTDSEATARGIAWLALQERTHWQALPLSSSYKPKNNVGLHKRFQQFKNYLMQEFDITVL